MPRPHDSRLAALLLVLSLGLLTACGSGGSSTADDAQAALHPDGIHAIVLAKPFTLPDATLTDSHGAAYSLRQQTTKPLTLVFFGYTRCPDICQVVMANIAAGVLRLPRADQAKVAMLFITSDPARDTPAVLRSYLDHFNPAFEGLTGPLPTIVSVGRALGVAIDKGAKLPSGGYDVVHGTSILGVVPSGKAPLVWTENATSAEFAADIEKVLADGVPHTSTGAS